MDFGDIDISDLGPPEKEESVMDEQEENLSMESAANDDDVAPSPASEGGKGLEDLQLDDLDLESPSPPPAKGKKLAPGMKTGTALDDFDLDLGELFPEKE
jgi:hypothetical protein